MINVDNIEHQQIYTQFLSEIEQGAPYYFSKAEEQEMQQHNQPYYVKTELERGITRFYKKATSETDGIKMSATTIIENLKKKHVKGIEHISMTSFCRTLTRLFGSPIHTNCGNLYLLARV